MAVAADKKGTLKALARQLDLSITTVSRALGGYADVAESTRSRVIEAAARAGYVPNSAAKMLVTGRSGFVGFLLPLRERATLDPFLGEYIAGLSEGLAERGRDLFMATVPPSKTELQVLQHVVESGRADAIALTRVAAQDERVDFLLSRNIPFVTHGRTLEQADRYSWIDTDGYSAFGDTFHWLYQLGHRRFGLLSIEEAMSFRTHREDGLMEAIEQVGDPCVTLHTQRAPRFDENAIENAIERLLTPVDRPSAILALTDELGLLTLEVAKRMNITIPDQLSVVAFDNIPASAYSQPGLTTYDQSIRQAAHKMAVSLSDSLDGVQGCRQELITPELIKRGSHAVAPQPSASVPFACHDAEPLVNTTTESSESIVTSKGDQSDSAY